MAHDGAQQRQKAVDDEAEMLAMFLTDPILLPGENKTLFDDFARAVRRLLDPRNILQRLACDDIVNLRWEILRHRRFRKMSAERFFAGDVQMIFEGSDFAAAEDKPTSESEVLGRALETISRDPERRASAMEFFERNTGVDPEAVLADAYTEAPAVRYHDAKLNMLMRQHRQAMRDYEAMKIDDDRGEVPDAEIVLGSA